MGATIKPGPMVTAEPECITTDADLADVARESKLNGPFLADLLAAMATHENMSVNLFRALRSLTPNPMLTRAFSRFELESLEAVAVHVTLMEMLGVPQYYISPAARLTECMDGHLVQSLLGSGSADQLTIDMKLVEAVLLGATMCVSNTALLARIGEEAEGHTRAAVQQAVAALEGPQRQHLQWATETREKMVLALVQHPLGQKLAQFTETAIAKLTGPMAT
jgi:hypothetical protein